MRLFLLFSLLLSFESILAQHLDSVLQRSIISRLNNSEFENANISLSLIDVESNQLVASHRAHKVLVPASSLKLITTLSGIKVLGPEFRFKTTLYYSGNIDEEGKLDGDIIIKGGGDPTLGSTKFKSNLSFNALLTSLVKAIVDSGINCIDGDIVIDESIYDSYPISPSWQWNDLGNYYASGAWGVNINENQYFVHFTDRHHVGRQPKISSVFPKVPLLKLSNEVLVDSAGTGDQAYIFGGPYNNDKRIVGTIPQGKSTFTIKGSIPDPPKFLGYHIKSALERENIQSQGYKTLFKPYKGKKNKITQYISPSLRDIVIKTNQESNNLNTESILKMIGLKKRGLGSGQNGINILKKELRKKGADHHSAILHDGSGLSARNNISSYSIAKFLAGLKKDSEIKDILTYIPKAGVSGTVRGLLKGSKAKGHVWLKSGSMEGIQSYSGFIQGQSGRWMSFCIIVNGFSGEASDIRSRIDSLIRDIYKLS